MKPIHIILTLLYLAVLLLFTGLYSRYATQSLPALLSVTGSTCHSRDQQNLVMVQATQKDQDQNYEHYYLRMNWHGDKADTDPVVERFPKSGNGVFVVGARPNKLVKDWKHKNSIKTNEGNVTECAQLRIDLIDTEQFDEDSMSHSGMNPQADLKYMSKFMDEHVVASAFVGCNDIWFDDMSLYTAFLFDQGFYNYYEPKTDFSVVPASAFFPGVPNKLFVADIRNSEPYTSEIITLVGEDGAKETRYQANPSGITPIEVTIHENTNLLVQAGNKTLDIPLEIDAQPFHIAINDHLITDDKRPRVHITHGEQTEKIVIDYFVGYAWIDRQVVSLSQTQGDFELNPQYHFKREPEILYARFSTSGVFPDDTAQTIALIARSNDKRIYIENQNRQHDNANSMFGAIFQEYLKISKLNDSSIVRKTYPPTNLSAKSFKTTAQAIFTNPQLQEPYDLFAVAPSLKASVRFTGLKTCRSFEECSDAFEFDPSRNVADEFEIMEQYLLIRLARQHHPAIVEFTHSAGEVFGKFEASKLSRQRWTVIALVVWLTGGILVFGTIARRIRNRRQQAWFDVASRGKAKGMMPGAPIWLIVVVCVLCIGLISSICLLVSLL